MRWEQGRATIDQMITDGRLQTVPASREHADFLLAQARRHVNVAGQICDLDEAGAYQLAYDAARKAMTAILENQGLRPTAKGGHVAVYLAVRAQLDPPMGQTVKPFNRMRKIRNDSEYPTGNAPAVSAADVREDIPKVDEIIEMAARLIDQMDPF